MKENQKKAFDFAADTTKQLITISTAIITLTVTFSKDILGSSINSPKTLLICTWAVFILSIICGVLTLMTLTGTLQPLNNEKVKTEEEKADETQIAKEDECSNMSINNGNIRLFSIGQSLFFISAIIMTGLFGYYSLKTNQPENNHKNEYQIIRKSTLNNDTIKYIDTLYLPRTK
jgi:hypothetical protein